MRGERFCTALGPSMVAAAVHLFLVDDDPGERPKEINVLMGRLSEDEVKIFLESTGDERGVVPQPSPATFSDADGRHEAAACLHCDCRAARDCRLRDLATQYAASPSRYRSERRPFARDASHPRVIYEPGKCIDCGLCIQVAEAAGKPQSLLAGRQACSPKAGSRSPRDSARAGLSRLRA